MFCLFMAYVDRRIRVWDIIPEGAVREWAQAPDIITAVSITPDGKQVAGGLINGQVYFYEYDGMKYITQMDCHNSRGQYSAGNKVTSVQFISMNSTSKIFTDNASNTRRFSTVREKTEPVKSPIPLHNPSSIINSPPISSPLLTPSIPAPTFNKMLVTTNDNRIRLYDTDDYSLSQKFKAYTYRNTSMQIKASFSDNRKYIISGSDDGKSYVWSSATETTPTSSFSLTSLFNKFIPNISLPTRKSETEPTIINAISGKGQQHKQVFKNNSYEYFSGNRAYYKIKNTSAVETTSASSGTNPAVVNENKSKEKAVNKVIAIPTTVSVFAPSKSIETVIRKHPRINSMLNSHKSTMNTNPNVYNAEFEKYVTNMDVDDLCTRIIVTADCEGRILVILRGIKI